jgi:hypothetical protein
MGGFQGTLPWVVVDGKVFGIFLGTLPWFFAIGGV